MSEGKDPFARPGSIPGFPPFAKADLNPKAPEEIFLKSAGRSGSSKKSRENREHADGTSREVSEEVQNRVLEIPEETPRDERQPRKRTVRIVHARWDREQGHFNKKAIAAVEAEALEGGKAKGRVEFTLFAEVPEGKRERIDGTLADLRDGHAEAEFTLYFAQGKPRDQAAIYLFTARHAESEEAEGPRIKVEALHCNDSPPPAPAEQIGTCPYYTWRNGNFMERHQACNRNPPKYYLGYGYKYCVRFSTETHPKLSEKGKKWLEMARKNLQVAIEHELEKNGKIELNSEDFERFAFASHPDAYWDAGLGELHPLDLLLIGWTPDLKEWLDEKSRIQVYDIGGRIFELWKEEAKAAIRMRSEEVKNYFRDILK